jgi:hypothetical protein
MSNKSLTSFAELTKSIQDQSTTGLTFNIVDVESKIAKSGNVGYRVKLANEQVVTFWSQNLDQVIEAIDDKGNHRVIAGTRITDDGSLIPKDAKNGGFWD